MECTDRAIRKRIGLGQLSCTQRINANNRPEYAIPLSALPADAQRKYYAQQAAAVPAFAKNVSGAPSGKRTKAFDQYSEAEREEIAWWQRTLVRWAEYRARPGASAAQTDERFIALLRLEEPERSVSVKTLYRKRKALAEGNLDGLIDGRGRSSKTTLHPEVARVFKAFYLQETKQSNIQEAIRGTELYFEAHDPEKLPLPSYSTFYRIAQSIPPQIRELGINGYKSWRDEYGLYIRRDYRDLCSNDYWVSDSHTFDVLTKPKVGKPHKLYLTAFLDARSGIYVGWYVTDKPCSQATLYALRRAIEKYGIPAKILSDNGREFLTRDVGGLGHRARKPKPDEPVDPPPIFQRLGIQLVCAKVRNAQAKPIERQFLDMKGQFSTLWESFTGGNTVEKPECLKKVMKQGHVPTDEELVEAVDTLINGYFNLKPYSGPIMEDRDLRRMDVYHLRHRDEIVRPASEEDLSLMMLRSTRPQKVGQRGVHVTVSGVQFDYFTPEFLWDHADERVFVRYDPDHLQSCRVYDLEERFIAELPLDTKLTVAFDGSREEIAQAMIEINRHERRAKEQLKAMRVEGIDRRTLLELKLASSRKAAEEYVPPEAKTPIRLKYAEEKQAPLPLRAAVGQVDIETVTRNTILMKGDIDDGDDEFDS